MSGEAQKISEIIESQLKDVVFAFKYGRYGEKKQKRGYIILGKYMLSVFLKDKYKKPEVKCPLVILKDVNLAGTSLTCKYGDGQTFHFHFKDDGDSNEFLKKVQEKYQMISTFIKPVARCVFKINGKSIEPIDKEPASPLLKYYEAFCRAYGEMGREGISKYFKFFQRGKKEIDLMGIDDIKLKGENMVNLNPVLNMIAASTYFEGFSVTGFPGGGLFTDVTKLLSASYSLKKISLVNCNVRNEELAQFVKSIGDGKECTLTYLNLSKNSLRDEGFALVARLANVLPLTGLLLKNCKASQKGCCVLLEGLYKNPEFPKVFTELDLSRNSFNSNPGSTLIFKSFFKKAENIQKVGLAFTDIVMYKFVDCLYENKYKLVELKKLDLSGNKIDAMEMSDIVKVVKNIPSLAKIHLNETDLTSGGIKFLMKEIITGNETRIVQLSANNNKLGQIPEKLLETFKFGCTRNISHLSIFNNKISNATVADLMKVFKGSPFIVELNIGGNLRKPTPEQATQIGTALSEIPNLKKLMIAGVEGTQIEENMHFMLEPLVNAPSLVELDISYNKLGKTGVSRFGSFIRALRVLQVFNFDMNSADVTAFKVLSDAVSANKTLLPASFPTIDYQMILKKLVSGKKFDEAVLYANQLKTAFQRNQKTTLQKETLGKIEKKRGRERVRQEERERKKKELEENAKEEKERIEKEREEEKQRKIEEEEEAKRKELEEEEAKKKAEEEEEEEEEGTARSLGKFDVPGRAKYLIAVGEEEAKAYQADMLFTVEEITKIVEEKSLGKPSDESIEFYKTHPLPENPDNLTVEDLLVDSEDDIPVRETNIALEDVDDELIELDDVHEYPDDSDLPTLSLTEGKDESDATTNALYSFLDGIKTSPKGKKSDSFEEEDSRNDSLAKLLKIGEELSDD